MRIYSNTAVATSLVGAIGAADTSLTLADATGFPAPGTGESALLWIEGELLEYTSLVGAVVSGITRGVDGTVAAAHAAGVAESVKHVASARDIRPLETLRFVRDNGERQHVLPGVAINGRNSAAISTAYRYYYPYRLHEARTLAGLSCEVMTAATTAGAKARVAIVRPDARMQPVKLIADLGELAIDTTGAKYLAAPNVELPAGPILLTAQFTDVATLRTVLGTVVDTGIVPGWVNTVVSGFLVVDGYPASGFEDPPPEWQSATSGGNAFSYIFALDLL